MTKQEAIDRLKGLMGNNYPEQEEALNLAIMALEQVDIINTMKGQVCMPKGAFMDLYESHDDEDDI